MARDNDAPSRPLVLVVYSQAPDLPFIAQILEKEGYPADTAQGLAAAKRLLAKGAYAVVLIDTQLPGSEALQVFRESQLKDPHSVAVALVPLSTLEGSVAALRQGFYDALVIPCPPEMLAACVERAVERWELNRRTLESGHEVDALRRDLDLRVVEATHEIQRVNERLNRRLTRQNEELAQQTRFMEDMVHELKNPLSVVSGYSSFLLRRPMEEWTSQDLTRALESIHRNADHLRDLIEELLDSTRLAGRKIQLHPETFPASEAVRETVEGLKVQAAEKGLGLEMDVPDTLAAVYADRNRLRQILINLIGNALKFTPKGGRVTVSAKPEEGEVCFSVADTGKGIAKKDLERIFERFYQVQETRATHKGLGLGLSIVRGLVDLHGGRIWAESAPGKGARFCFTLPSTLTVPGSTDELAEESAANPS
ncbi:MAG: ATP-binding protein [Elusimicrobiota bacterium]|jgi:signal transduction histidine kinase